ncbi:hypothetical protein SAMN04487783_2569 [Agrococcus baldri]|uniref:Uncharacterized protein n=1 Tax=Agrococcus baldri TaxID=153730 RepID=A0AA94L0K3_9MICO|nr:hypothetical protein [Agrococcus baldri]SFS18210.1 hypothetical protein SAMN04487783_2569 [Agrococcus baldri]
MSQTLVPERRSIARTTDGGRSAVTWSSPSEDLWVASRSDAGGAHFLGFIERSLDLFHAVDGQGVGLGRHSRVDDARQAVLASDRAVAASAPESWSAAGAPVLAVRDLRRR